MKNFIIVLTSMVFLCAACKSKKEKNSPGGLFYDISAPSGWIKIDTFLGGQRVLAVKSLREGPGDRFMENVTVLVEPREGSGEDAFIDAMINDESKTLAMFELKSRSSETINGKILKTVEYTHLFNGDQLLVKAYFVFDREDCYLITLTTEVSSAYRFKPAFDEIIRSFTIKND